MKRLLRGGVILVVLVIASFLSGCAGGDSTAEAAQAQVMTVEAKPGSVQVKVEGPALVGPYRLQTLRAQIEGIVVSTVAEGDPVAAGAVLVRFDSVDQDKAVRQAELALAQARLNLERARAAVEMARGDLESKQRLAASGAVARDQVDSAAETLRGDEYALKTAEITLSQAELALETARRDREATAVRAPFAGVVLSTQLNPGDLVSKGAALLELADLSRVRLEAEVDEFDIARVQPEQTVTVTSEALSGETLSGRVERISPAAEVVNNISIFKVSSVLDNKEGRLRPGMSADMSILISADKGLVVPSKAVSTVRTRSYLKVLENEEVVTKRVTIGADDGVNVAVLEGIEEGAIVVLPTSAGLNLTTGTTSSGSSVIPISVPGVRTN